MSRIGRNRITAFLLIVFVALYLPNLLSAMPYQQFDSMNMLDQAEYIAMMVYTTQAVLRNSGGANYAAQIEQLFGTIKPGGSMSIGLAELEGNIDEIRVQDLKRVIKDPKARRMDVEVALLVTLKNNNIPITQPFVTAVKDALANFHCMTNAEFEAETPAEQRRYIAVLAKIGLPDTILRQEMEDLQKSKKPGAAPFNPNAGSYSPEARKLRVDLAAQHFPNGSTDQPGFAEVAKKIRIDYASRPTANGAMYSVYVYLLELEDAELDNEMKRMRDNTGHYPQAENGERNAPPPPAAASPAPATAAPPPAPAAPLTPPASSRDDDDPIGGGGFITPPNSR
jgi:hypothetical protein